MKLKTFIYIICALTILSCGNVSKNSSDDNKNDSIQVPEILNENSDLEWSSMSKRYNADIIQKLYNEAVEKNSELKKLNDQVNKLPQFKNDSLYAYKKFSDTNKRYWNTADRYINQLQDSILKKSTFEIFKKLKLTYEAKMSDHERKLISINEKTLSLNDQLIVMKLLITEPLIKNYQISKQPNIKTLENIISEYDRILEKTKEYTQITK